MTNDLFTRVERLLHELDPHEPQGHACLLYLKNRADTKLAALYLREIGDGYEEPKRCQGFQASPLQERETDQPED